MFAILKTYITVITNGLQYGQSNTRHSEEIQDLIHLKREAIRSGIKKLVIHDQGHFKTRPICFPNC